MFPFIVQKLKKILSVDPEFWGGAIFCLKMTHSPQENCRKEGQAEEQTLIHRIYPASIGAPISLSFSIWIISEALN